MQAMILAAGHGSRLRPFSFLRPKPLFPVFDKALLLLLIDQLRRAGFDRLLVNAHHLASKIVGCLEEQKYVQVLVETDILGTGGGLRNALPFLVDEPLLVINGDIVHNLDLFQLYQAHLAAASPVSMVVHHLPRFTSLAVDERNRVVGIGAGRPSAEGIGSFAFTGIHFIDPGILRAIPRTGFYNIIDLYRQLIVENTPPHAIIVENHYWRDMGTLQDYLAVHHDMIRRPSIFSSLPPDIGSQGWISPQATLCPDTKIIDWAVVGAGVITEENVVLERTVVWDGTRIPQNSRFKDNVVADNLGNADFAGC